MAQQNSMRPQIPAGIARSPQFAAARSITQEGLPAAFKQLLEDEITFKAMELLDGSANEQAIGELPSPDSVRTQTREGLMSMLGSIGPGIQQQGSQMARAQQQGPQMAMAQQSGGLPSQPTSNMAQQFASGGIIGFAKGGRREDRVKTKAYRPQPAIPVGNSNQPIPMLMQKYGGEKVLGYLAEKKALDAKARALAEAGSAAGSMQIEDHKLMKEIFSEKYRDILNESMGMAGGGIVGFQDGGRIKRFQGLEGSEVEGSGGRIKRFEERAVIADEQVRAYLSSLGRDIADFTAQQIAAVKEIMGNTNLGASSEARAARAAQIANVANMPLDMLNSPVARSQNDIMSQVGRGAMGAIADAVPDNLGAASADARRYNQDMATQGGVPSDGALSLTDQLLAAERRRSGVDETAAFLRNIADSETMETNPTEGGIAAHNQRVREAEMGRRDPTYGQGEAGNIPSEFQQGLIDAGNANVNDQLLAADLRRRAENKPEGGIAAHNQRVREAEMGRRDPNYGQQEALVPPNQGGGIMNALKGIFNSDDAAVARQELQQVMQGTGSRGQESEGGIRNALKGIFNSDDAAVARQELQQVMQGTGTRGQEEGIASLSDAAREAVANSTSRGPEYWTGVAPANPNNVTDSDYRAGEIVDPRRMSAEARETMNAFYEKNAGIPSTLTGGDREAALREYYKDSRSGDSSTVDVPMFPEATYQINKYADSDRFGSSVLRRMRENPEETVSAVLMGIPALRVAGVAGGFLATKLAPYMLKHPGLVSFLTGAAMKVPWEKLDVEGYLSELGLGEDYEEVKDTLLTAALGEDPMRPPTDTATSIIKTGPTREEIAANVGRKPEGGFSLGNVTEDTVVETPRRTTETVVEAPAENGMPAIDSFDSEVTTTGAGTADSAGLGTFLADSVAGNISTASAGYQAKLDAAIARQDDPLQAISTFLRAMGEGDTIGEGMQIAGKALDSLRRSNDAEQIALLQLLETGRISEQDFQLKRLQIQNEKDQIIEYRENSKRVLQAAQGRVAASVSAALMGQYQDVFQDVADREAMSQTLLQQAENEAAREVGGVPRFGGINKLNKDPAFTALVNTKLTVLMENAIAAQLQKASRYAGRP